MVDRKIYSSFLIALFAYLVCNAGISYARPHQKLQAVGEITGKVVDENGDGMPGASVQDQESGKGTLTNADGSFRLTDIPVGQRKILVSFIGYQKASVDVKVQEGIVVNANVRLQVSDEMLGEVVIKAQAEVRYSPILNSTDVQLVSVMKRSEGILTGISNEQIVKSTDRDASQIAQRISGISLVDRFVVVRGMDPRYNLTLINGIVGPSSEEESRAFSYDALPTGVIDRIELEKAPGPHLPAMWGGGVVKIFTRNFATARQFNFDISGAYRTRGSSFTNDVVTYEGSSNDWFANGANDRRLPKILTTPYFNYPDFQTYPVENVAIARAGEFRTYTPSKKSHNMDKRLNFSYYDSWKLGKLTLNNLTAASYTEERIFRVTDRAFRGANYTTDATSGSGAVEIVQTSEGITLYRNPADEMSVDSLHEEQVRISAVQSVGLLINDENDVSVTLFYNRFGTDQVLNREGSNSTDEPTEIFKSYSYIYNQREIIVGQLGGNHRYKEKNSLEWTVGASRTKNDVPDRQTYRFIRDTRTDPEGLWRIVYGDVYSPARFQSHYVTETEERSFTGRIDYKRDFADNFYLKAGVFFDRKDRSFFSHIYNILNIAVNSTTGKGADEVNKLSEPWNKVDSVYAAENFSTDKLFLEAEATNEQLNYFFDDESREAYVALSLPITENFSFYGGARVANFQRILYDNLNRAIDSVEFEGEIVEFPDKNVTYILPSGTLKYAMGDGKYIIRAVYGQSIDRPQFREQSNQLLYDPLENRLMQGNPYIENSLIHHADLRLEYYPQAGEVMTLGGFYKYIDKPIARFTAAFSVPQVEYRNIGHARVFGVELEARKKFDFLSLPVLRKMSLNLNASYIWSEAVDTDETVTRRLQGTSPYLANASLYYEDTDRGTLFSAIFNLTWDRIRDYAAYEGLGNLVEGRRYQLDLVFKQRVTKFMTIKAGVQNILDQKIRFYRDADESYSYDSSPDKVVIPENSTQAFGDYIEQEYRAGAYYSVALNFNF